MVRGPSNDPRRGRHHHRSSQVHGCVDEYCSHRDASGGDQNSGPVSHLSGENSVRKGDDYPGTNGHRMPWSCGRYTARPKCGNVDPRRYRSRIRLQSKWWTKWMKMAKMVVTGMGGRLEY